MGDVDIREILDRIPVDDPPYSVPVEAIVTAGRQAKRRWRIITAATVALAGGTALVAAVLLGPDRIGVEHPPTANPSPDGAATSAASPSFSRPVRTWKGKLGTTYYYPAPDTGVFGAILDTVRAVSPAGYRFDLQADTLGEEWRIDGNADDGRGPGRVLITVSRTGAGWARHPCSDPEFTAGATCNERRLPDGSRLVRRGVSDDHGYKTIIVMVVRDQGVSVHAETGNYRSPIPTQDTITSASRRLKITREYPLYNLAQLQRMVQTIDRTIQDCIRPRC